MKKGRNILVFVSVIMIVSGCAQNNNQKEENIPVNDYKVQEENQNQIKDNKVQEENQNQINDNKVQEENQNQINDNKVQEENQNQINDESVEVKSVKINKYEINIPEEMEISGEKDNVISLNSDKFQALISIDSKDEYMYVGEEELYQYEEELKDEPGFKDVKVKTRNGENYVYIELEDNMFMVNKYIDSDMIMIVGNYINEDNKKYGEEILMQILDSIQSKKQSSDTETVHNVVGDVTLTMPAKYKKMDTEGYMNENSLTFKKDGVGVITVQKQRKYSSIEDFGKNTAKSFLTIYDEVLRDEIITMPYGDIYYGEYISEKHDDALIFAVINYRDVTIKVSAMPEGNAKKDVTENLDILRSDIKIILDKMNLGI